MSRLARSIRLAIVFCFMAAIARADEGSYPIKAEDGTIVANHRVPAELESQIEKLAGVIIAGNPRGEVTLNEFYDVNCPYCRQASADIDVLMRSDPQLRLVLVPFPVLGIASIQGTRVELAVGRLAPTKFYASPPYAPTSRAALSTGTAPSRPPRLSDWDEAQVLKIANEDFGRCDEGACTAGDALAI